MKYSIDEIDGLRFVLTCSACPEQYDVFKGDEQIAYVRYRHGSLTVETPDCGERLVLHTDIGDLGILSDAERAKILPAIAAILSVSEFAK